jgi:hypothetical protein
MTRIPRAKTCIHEPMLEADSPIQNRRKSRKDSA